MVYIMRASLLSTMDLSSAADPTHIIFRDSPVSIGISRKSTR